MRSTLPTRRIAAPARKVDAIVFDLVLVVFVGALVVVALAYLDSGARLVPLIIGIPTLAGLVVQLVLDVFPGLRKAARRSPVDEPAGTDGPADADAAGAEEQGRSRARREVVFAAWVAGIVVLTATIGLLVAIPVALLFFFKVLSRESWVLALSLTAGIWIFIYVLFDVVLGVPF